MDFENIAWNNFCKTGDIQSFLEYRKIGNIYNNMNIVNQNKNEQIMQNLEVMINEVNKSQGDSDKGSTL